MQSSTSGVQKHDLSHVLEKLFAALNLDAGRLALVYGSVLLIQQPML